MTIEHVGVMPEAEARRLTERIRYTALSVRDGVEKLQRLVGEAQEGQAHLALGYASWPAYLAEVLGEEPLRLARDERREVVGWLAGEGMSTRAIAPIVGVHHDTVATDIRAGVGNPTPSEPATITTADGFVVAEQRGIQLPPFDPTEPWDGDAVTARAIRDAEGPHETRTPVTGLDGKTYARPEPSAPRRKALTDALRPKVERIWSDSLDLAAAVEDDRFAANRTSLSDLYVNRARSAAVAITNFMAQLDMSAAVETEEARDQMVTDLNHISETFARLARSL